MGLTLELSAELEQKLTAEATRLRLPLSEYAIRLLSAGVSPSRPTNGAELIAYWQSAGIIGSRPEIQDSPEHARALREIAEKRER